MQKRVMSRELCLQISLYIYLCTKRLIYLLRNLTISLPSVIVLLLQDFEDVFPKETPSGLPSKENRTLLILSMVLQFQIDQLIDVILRKQRRYKSKLVSSWRRGT